MNAQTRRTQNTGGSSIYLNCWSNHCKEGGMMTNNMVSATFYCLWHGTLVPVLYTMSPLDEHTKRRTQKTPKATTRDQCEWRRMAKEELAVRNKEASNTATATVSLFLVRIHESWVEPWRRRDEQDCTICRMYEVCCMTFCVGVWCCLLS